VAFTCVKHARALVQGVEPRRPYIVLVATVARNPPLAAVPWSRERATLPHCMQRPCPPVTTLSYDGRLDKGGLSFETRDGTEQMHRRMVLDARGNVGINLPEGVEAEATLHVAGTASFGGVVEVADSLAVGTLTRTAATGGPFSQGVSLSATEGMFASSVRGLGVPARAAWDAFEGQACWMDAVTNRSAALASSPGECRAECLLAANCTAVTWYPEREAPRQCFLLLAGVCQPVSPEGGESATVWVKPGLQVLDLVEELMLARAEEERMKEEVVQLNETLKVALDGTNALREEVVRMNETLQTMKVALDGRNAQSHDALREEVVRMNETLTLLSMMPYLQCMSGKPGTCGDGLKQEAEACDDGNAVSWDGCSSSCTVESNWMCDGTSCAVSSCTSLRVWSYSTGFWVYSSPALSSDGAYVYVGSHDNKLYKIRTSDGTKMWDYATGNDVSSSPALSSNGAYVYVGSFDNKLYKIRTH